MSKRQLRPFTQQLGFVYRWLVIAVAAVGLLVVCAPWLLPPSFNEIGLEALQSRYAAPQSQFVNLNGVRVHYADQGEGPVVVLLHASFMNLRTWDSLAAALEPNYRVIRLDLLASGLTGPEPNDNYSFDRSLELLHLLMQELGVEQFALLGTSSGGIVAFNYAALYPQQVVRLMLVNSAGLPRNALTNPNRVRGNSLLNWAKRRYQTRAMVREELDTNFIEPYEPPDWLVDMSYDMRRREGLKREGALLLANFRTGDPQAILPLVQAPTLIIWGMDNQTVFHLEADVFQRWLTSAPTLVKKYTGVGHYLYLENSEQFESELREFLAGRLDQQMSVWQRVPYTPEVQGAVQN